VGRKKKDKPKHDGITFDSKLEIKHYKLFNSDPDITIVELQKEFELFPPFEYIGLPLFNKRKYRKMVYTPDFIIKFKNLNKPIAVESKGYPRKDYFIRKKLFMMKYSDDYYFLESNSEKDMISKMKQIKEGIKK